ncbi:amino acid adenylation domain-containing protein [Nonomuraea sp. NPDC049152]|uniref:amino acid adenylation domain-containing protein n=1 Tax=Nonomuraea sp. NPDC049152 TaxID=3154350 RepID=UPI0033DDDCA1
MSSARGEAGERPRLITVSAPSTELLARHAERLAQYLASHRLPFAEVASTLQRRSAHAVRFSAVVHDGAELVDRLRAVATGEAAQAPVVGDRPRLVFAFTGQGSQYAGMGAALLDEPVFAAWFEQAQEILSEFDVDLEAIVRGAQPPAAMSSTRTAAPAIHTVSVGILAVLESWGVKPHSVLGHSLGEYAAAVAAGVLEPVESLRLVAERSRLMDELAQPGAMAAVRLGMQDAALLLAEFPALDLAAVNSPHDVVFSGPPEEVERLLGEIRGQHRASRLNVGQAFHSRMMTQAAAGFAKVTAPLGLRPPALPFLRCEPDGTQLDELAPVAPDYWVRQMTGTVRYDRLVGRLAAVGDGGVLIVEVGPQPMVTRYHQAAGLDGRWTLDRAGAANTALLAALGQLWSAGAVDVFTPTGQAPRLHLPATPLSGPDGGRQVAAFGESASTVGAAATGSAPAAPVGSPAVPPVPPSAAGGSRELLEQIWTSTVGDRPVPDKGIISSGADSLTLLRMRQRMAAHWASVPTVEDLFGDPTIDELEQMLAGPRAGDTPAGELPLDAARGADEFPVSRMQSALLTARALGEPQENVVIDAEVGSVLDASRLCEAFDAVQEQVEVLRTRFTIGQNGWRATVADRPQTHLRLVRAGANLDATALHELAALSEPLPPEAPLTACAVIGDNRTRLLIACHHAVADARSMGLLLQRWAAVYSSEADAPEAAPDCRHRALVEVGMLELPATVGHASRPESVRRVGFDRGPEASGPPREVTRRLDSATTQRLRALCATEQSTLPMVALTALAATLRVYDPDRDVVVGMPVDIRYALQEPEACGPLIDVVVLSWPNRPGESFLDLLAVTRAETVRALTTAGTCAERPEQGFDVMFSVPETGAPGDFCGHRLTLREISVTQAKFPLTVALLHDADGITLGFEYDSGRVPPAVAEAIADCVLRCLTAAAHDPSCPITAVGIPLDAETAAPAEPAQAPALAPMLSTLLAGLAARGAEPVLRVGTDRKVGGRYLADRITRLATAMGARGVGPGSLVALLLPADADVVVAMLAVLAAGAAYLPLDPSAPRERNRAVLSAARPDLIIALPGDQEASACTVDSLVDEGEAAAAADLPVLAPDGALAYVISTSGTTGTPKDVAIPRAALASYLDWALDAYAADGPIKSALVSSLSVDLSVTSVFLPLLSGGELWLPGAGRMDDAVLRAAAAADATARGLLKATPSHLEFLVRAGGGSLPWERLVVGGEPLRGSLVEDLRSRRPEVRIINEYGPTEATVGCVVYDVPAGADHDAHPNDDQVPIGQPIRGCIVRVLDEGGHAVPLGAVGELYLGGAGLAWGYRDNPRATATAFVPDPLGSGTRLYRTGDLVRWDGERLRFLGRATTGQVKVRGHRIELGEVTAALRRLPGVSAAHVVAERSIDGSTRLTAQVVGTLPQDAKSRLATWLPGPAIPATISVVDSLPIALGGKRGALSAQPEPVSGHARAGAPGDVLGGDPTGSAFAGEDERAVAGVWSQVLEQAVEQPEDDFFALGGNSLTVLMAMADLRERFPRVEAQDFYTHPTVAQLAAHLTKAASQDVPSPGGAAEERPSAQFAVTGATGLLGARVVARLLADGRTVLALARPLAGADAEERVHRALREAGADEETFGRLHVVGLDLSDPAAQPPVGQCATGGVLIHTAADIRHFGDPGDFQRINVDGTRKVAGWALRDGLALLHVSSSGLADLEELRESEREPYLASPYVRSKWQAEHVVQGHAERDQLRCRIVRVGSLVGDSHTGRFPQDPGRNRIYRVLKAILVAGAAPSTHQWGLDLLPADVAAEAVAALAAAPMSEGVDMVHVVNPVPLSFAELAVQLRDCGYDVADSDVDTIISRLRQDAWPSAKEAEATLAAWFGEPDAKQSDPDLTRLIELLPGMRVPLPDRRLLAVLVEEMVRTGFLPAPDAAPIPADA